MKLNVPSLDELVSSWENDSQIDITEPGKEILRIPVLHSKYNKFLAMHNISAKKISAELAKLKKLKWMYYNGKMSKEDLQKFGWEQFSFTLKSDISVYLEGDEDLAKLTYKKSYHEEAAKFCEYVMKELNSRTFQLREYMTHERFIQGAR